MRFPFFLSSESGYIPPKGEVTFLSVSEAEVTFLSVLKPCASWFFPTPLIINQLQNVFFC